MNFYPSNIQSVRAVFSMLLSQVKNELPDTTMESQTNQIDDVRKVRGFASHSRVVTQKHKSTPLNEVQLFRIFNWLGNITTTYETISEKN